jgi:hypothetical protein
MGEMPGLSVKVGAVKGFPSIERKSANQFASKDAKQLSLKPKFVT